MILALKSVMWYLARARVLLGLLNGSHMIEQDHSDEAKLERTAKRLLAMPHKPREESKLGKSSAKTGKSPRKRKALRKRG